MIFNQKQVQTTVLQISNNPQLIELKSLKKHYPKEVLLT